MKLNFKAIIFEWLPTILIAIALSIGIRTYVAEAMWIPSSSMYPTLDIGDRLLVDKISLKFKHQVKRGDIVVFIPPPSAYLDEKFLIKRVIGLPGETISIQDGVVYINGKALDEPYILEKTKDDFGPYEIPEDSIFVMGDNRNGSYDSRSWGPVPMDNLVGKALFRYYPLSQWGAVK